MKFLKFFSFLSLIVLALASCGSKSGNDPQYFPFKETESEGWGMISPEGEILFTDEFEELPTVVFNDRFFVKNDKGLWNMYTAEATPVKVGGSYEQVLVADADVFAVVKKGGKKIDFIDKEGEVKFSLSKLGGKSIVSLQAFYHGLAIVCTEGNLYGVINTKGETVIEPKYCALIHYGEGRLAGIEKKYKDGLDQNEPSKVRVSILNASGETIYKFAGDKYEPLCYIVDDMMGVKKDDACGIIDMKGEYIIRPSKKFDNINEIRNGHFTFTSDEKYGLKNLKGETIVKPRYEQLLFVNDDLLVAKEDGESFLIDLEGKHVGNETFQYLFYAFRNSVIVKVDDDIYALMDLKGQYLKGAPEMYDYNTPFGDGTIVLRGSNSDHFDYDEAPVDSCAVIEDDYYGYDSTDW